MNKCMSNDDCKLLEAVAKCMLVGAFIGGSACYIAAKDFKFNCKQARRKTAMVIKGAGKLLNKAADRMY